METGQQANDGNGVDDYRFLRAISYGGHRVMGRYGYE